MTTDQTPLDHAHAAMSASEDDDALRLRFYDLLAGSEVYVLLKSEPDGDEFEPELFKVGDVHYALAFDREERLADFVGRSAPYMAVSGRLLAGALGQGGLGLGVNLGAGSAMLIDPPAVAWLAETVGHTPELHEARPEEITAPTGLPDALLVALDRRLASATARARMAYLVGVRYGNGVRSHMLAFVDPVPGAEGALAQLVSEALVFSGLEAGALDVAFFPARDPVSARLAKVGLRFDLPDGADHRAAEPKAPGSDPDTPPILR